MSDFNFILNIFFSCQNQSITFYFYFSGVFINVKTHWVIMKHDWSSLIIWHQQLKKCVVLKEKRENLGEDDFRRQNLTLTLSYGIQGGWHISLYKVKINFQAKPILKMLSILNNTVFFFNNNWAHPLILVLFCMFIDYFIPIMNKI